MDRAKKLSKANVDLLVIDTAHGHSKKVIDVLKSVKAKYSNIDVIVGNIATAKAAEELINAGADAVKAVSYTHLTLPTKA